MDFARDRASHPRGSSLTFEAASRWNADENENIYHILTRTVYGFSCHVMYTLSYLAYRVLLVLLFFYHGFYTVVSLHSSRLLLLLRWPAHSSTFAWSHSLYSTGDTLLFLENNIPKCAV